MSSEDITVIERLISGDYIMERSNKYCLYTGNQIPVMWVRKGLYYQLNNLLRRCRKNYHRKYLNLNLVRQLDGRCIEKVIYKQQKQNQCQ